MSAVIKLPDNDDDGQQTKKKPKTKSKKPLCSTIRSTSHLILKLFGAILTTYICVISSRRYFMYWVQTTIERTDVHVSEIAFPAITICPTQLVLGDLNVTSKETQDDVDRRRKLYNLIQKILWNTPEGDMVTPRDFHEFQNFSAQSLYDLDTIVHAEFKCEELFQQCKWRRRVIDCCSIFRRFGLGVTCYSFNSLHANAPDSTWPWSVAGAGFNSGLNVKIHRNVGDTRVESLGVVVQEPNQYLGSSVTYSSDDRIVIPLQPIRFTAETAVKARPVNMRYCYFTEELALNGQSRSECIHNCHVTYMTKMCNCQYNLPMAIKRQQEDEEELVDQNGKSYRRCTVKDLQCFQKHKVSLFSMSNIIEESNDYIFNTTNCECYPNCNHIQYHASIFTDSLSARNHSFIELDVFFQEETLFSYCSTLHMTFLDLMVAFGGIAGLILGTSVIGAINNLIDRIGCCGKPSSHPA